MKTFYQWAKDNSYDLVLERGLRTGLHYPMPTGYVKAHYPDGYPMPSLATAAQDIKNFSQYKDKAPPDNAP